MNQSVSVVVVEDHALTRAGIVAMLSEQFRVVGEAGDGEAALALVASAQPNVAVVDLGLPRMDGITLTARLREVSSSTRVVIMTMVDVEAEVIAAMAAGAEAYCLKSSPPETLVDAVRIAAEGGAYFDPQIAHVVLSRFSPRATLEATSPLSSRELDVLRLIADGRGNTEIADTLHIGLGTVKGHIRDILDKLSATDRTQAAVTALRRGLI